MTAYITSTGSFLPGAPVGNEEIETILGCVNAKPSRLKGRILRANGIVQRHYAMDSRQQTTHTVAGMGAEAARICIEKSSVPLRRIGMLSSATSQGDLVLPGIGSMIQAELGIPEVELHTTHGVCSSSLMAVKAAANSIRLGEHENALVVVSELASRLFKASRYEAVVGADRADFNAEFLRFMLSDGAGALLLQQRALQGSLRVDWIRSFAHADAFPVCMSIGSPAEGHESKTWQDYATYAEAEAAGALLIRQDVRLLDNLIRLGVDGALRLIEEGLLDIQGIDHFLCHYSSHHFRGKIADMLEMAGAAIAPDKWFTNLYTCGNTGSASILIMLNGLLRERALRPNDRIFCMVPESGRFNCAYMQLTVMGPE